MSFGPPRRIEPAGLARARIGACTIELNLHVAIVALCVAPVILIGLPISCGSIWIAMLLESAATLVPALGSFQERVLTSEWGLLWAMSSTSLLVAGASVLRHHRAARERETQRRCRPISGPAGVRLAKIAGDLWRQLGGRTSAIPAIVWFSNTHVLARAFELQGVQKIQVSTALWERAAKNDPLAKIIVAHEMAHLLHHDPALLRYVKALEPITRSLARFLNILGTATLVAIVVRELISPSEPILAPARMLLHSTLAVSLCWIVVPLSITIVRRYSSFIYSLIEIRADISAASLNSSLAVFADTLGADQNIRRSTGFDRLRSLVGLDLSHLSESERIELAASTERLATPKLRYFALSLVLPLLLSLNIFVAMFFGGILSHFAISIPVAGLCFLTISMTLVAAQTVMQAWPWSRLGSLAAGSSLASMLPHLPLDPIGYLGMHLVASLKEGGGLGDSAADTSCLESIRMTMADMSQKLGEAAFHGWILATMITAFLGLCYLWRRAAGLALTGRQRMRMAMISASVGSFVGLLVSYETFRSGFFSIWPLSYAARVDSATAAFPWLRPNLPIISAIVCLEALLIVGPWIARRLDSGSSVDEPAF